MNKFKKKLLDLIAGKDYVVQVTTKIEWDKDQDILKQLQKSKDNLTSEPSWLKQNPLNIKITFEEIKSADDVSVLPDPQKAGTVDNPIKFEIVTASSNGNYITTCVDGY